MQKMITETSFNVVVKNNEYAKVLYDVRIYIIIIIIMITFFVLLRLFFSLA